MPINPNEKIVIIGAGPTGLGAAWRLQELGHANWALYEAREKAGGLATSYVDDQGFTWDVGGHVQFSHYPYFDALMDSLLGTAWNTLERESWVRILDRFVPYPFQNNLKFLPPEALWPCLEGLIDVAYQRDHPTPANFEAWILASFGQGIADLFMLPYNFKVWAYPARDMMFEWIGERVATVDLKRAVRNVVLDQTDAGWGPNHTFRFPKQGGTGAIWSALAARLESDKVHLQQALTQVDTERKVITFASGETTHYDHLITTMPLDLLLDRTDLDQTLTPPLLHSSTHVFGVGIEGQPPAHLQTKCWLYFPEDNCPFYRATVFSNYAEANVPKPGRQWSLMLEVAESAAKPVDHNRIWDQVMAGLLATGMTRPTDQIVSRWHLFEAYGYPTPSLHRNQSLELLKTLDALQIYSRGRFGAWKYEVSNQDHSLMQGVEIANRLLLDEHELTVWSPELVNRLRK